MRLAKRIMSANKQLVRSFAQNRPTIPASGEELATQEKLWETTREQNLSAFDTYMTKGFSAQQKHRVETLVKAFFELSGLERAVLLKNITESSTIRKPLCPASVSPDYFVPSELDDKGEVAEPHEEWMKESQSLKNIFTDEKMLAALGMKPGAPGGAGEAGKKEEAKNAKVVKEEKKVEEKKAFDVELTSFPPDAKVKLIKELKDLLKLGLKEVDKTLIEGKRLG
jgi:large subunit ribosomal protein L7/L12